MKRVAAVVVFLAGIIVAASPAAADHGPTPWACVAVYPINLGVCVYNPFP
ncbi:MAG: hypothetical protein KY439_02925 [Actinobacteria bacterium]|nr:hypothetical protein [Actinomycetota bacterium]